MGFRITIMSRRIQEKQRHASLMESGSIRLRRIPAGGHGPSSARLRALLRPFLPYSKICREAPVPELLAQRYRQAFAKNDPVVLSRGEKSVLAANETSQAARARQLPEPP
jgi:hypothetical protein